MALAEKIEVSVPEFGRAAKPSSKIRKKSKSKIAIHLVGMVICFAVANVVIQGLVVYKNNQIRQIQTLINHEERSALQLRLDIAALESFDRVQTIARNELGMKMAGPENYQIIPAVPAIGESRTDQTEQVARSVSEENVFQRITAWIGGMGKTMANTP